jgi:hypothetical protein
MHLLTEFCINFIQSKYCNKMQLLTIVSLFIVTAFTGAFKPTAWKANQLLRMSTSASNGAFLKFTSSKVKAAAAGLLLAGGLIALPVTPAWAAPVSSQSGSFKSIKLPNGVDFGIGRGDPYARLVYTCSDSLTANAQADVTTSVQLRALAVEPGSSTTCASKQITVSFQNPADKKITQVLAIDTPGNWQTTYNGDGTWEVVAAPK